MAEYKFETFQKVLVRNYINREWFPALYGFFQPGDPGSHFCLGQTYRFCVPYEGNEYLLGTTQEPEPEWKPEIGYLAAFSDDREHWVASPVVDIKEGSMVEKRYVSRSNVVWRYCEPIHKHFKVAK